MMSKDEEAQRFFEMFSQGESKPRLSCTEIMFQTGFPFPVQKCEFELRHAVEQDLELVAAAQAEIAFAECGVDPLVRDRQGFLERCSRRIGQKRVFVAFEGEKLVFKADIIAEASDIIYLEGVYVSDEYRGKGIGSRCLADLCRHLLGRASQICLLSNEEFENAHRSFRVAGLNDTGKCTTIFL
jgi:predicted GNAT family acetyltransferase